jgi:hypothetical protein
MATHRRMDILRPEGVARIKKIYEKEFPFKKFTPIKKKHATTHERRRTVMEHLLKLEKAFMKDLKLPKPKPATTTTIATLLKE